MHTITLWLLVVTNPVYQNAAFIGFSSHIEEYVTAEKCNTQRILILRDQKKYSTNPYILSPSNCAKVVFNEKLPKHVNPGDRDFRYLPD